MSLAIHRLPGVELRHARQAFAGFRLLGVEVDDFLVAPLEGEEDGVGGEDVEVGVQFLRAISSVPVSANRFEGRT